MSKLERRMMNGAPEVRGAEGDQSLPTLTGYAAVFDEISQYPIEGSFYEKIAPGAFKRALTDPKTDVQAVIQHKDDYLPIARYRGGQGTLKMWEDSKGLKYEFVPANTTHGRDVVESIKRGDVDGVSFAFRARKDSWSQSHNGLPLRTLQDVDFEDISIVTTPYYKGASVNLRSVKASEDEMSPDEYKRMATDNDVLKQTSKRARSLDLIRLTLND